MSAIMNPDNITTPLFVRVPQHQHNYLDSIKDSTGISKSDAVTLFLHVMSKLVDEKKLVEMFDEYMLDGDVVKMLLDRD
jgi:hypothetical protein